MVYFLYMVVVGGMGGVIKEYLVEKFLEGE